MAAWLGSARGLAQEGSDFFVGHGRLRSPLDALQLGNTTAGQIGGAFNSPVLIIVVTGEMMQFAPALQPLSLDAALLRRPAASVAICQRPLPIGRLDDGTELLGREILLRPGQLLESWVGVGQDQ
jgi:hypothetical protein